MEISKYKMNIDKQKLTEIIKEEMMGYNIRGNLNVHNFKLLKQKISYMEELYREHEVLSKSEKFYLELARVEKEMKGLYDLSLSIINKTEEI